MDLSIFDELDAKKGESDASLFDLIFQGKSTVRDNKNDMERLSQFLMLALGKCSTFGKVATDCSSKRC